MEVELNMPVLKEELYFMREFLMPSGSAVQMWGSEGLKSLEPIVVIVINGI